MSDLLDRFDAEYQRLYDGGDQAAGYREAVAWFDRNQGVDGVREHVGALIQERGDFISSDREAAAFTLAYRNQKGDSP